MSDTALAAPFPAPAATPAGPAFLPREHGSWSLALEPVALGLILAPSWPGAALGLAVFAGFLARRPVKAAFVVQHSPQRRAAREALVVLSALGAAGLFLVVAQDGAANLWPLLLALPYAGLFAWLDFRRESRTRVAELAGCTAFALVPAAVATLAGWRPELAFALAGFALARSAPTVLVVRTLLRRARGEEAEFILPVLAATAAVLGLGWLAAHLLLPGLIVLPAGLLFGRTLWFASPFRPAWSAKQAGILEAALGLIYLGGVALAWPH